MSEFEDAYKSFIKLEAELDKIELNPLYVQEKRTYGLLNCFLDNLNIAYPTNKAEACDIIHTYLWQENEL